MTNSAKTNLMFKIPNTELEHEQVGLRDVGSITSYYSQQAACSLPSSVILGLDGSE